MLMIVASLLVWANVRARPPKYHLDANQKHGWPLTAFESWVSLDQQRKIEAEIDAEKIPLLPMSPKEPDWSAFVVNVGIGLGILFASAIGLEFVQTPIRAPKPENGTN
ncbi:MAG: hypothetical protein HY291_07255 [Planctomycetes bacterium]|nr:hypothetical protein [Planctomycetota bacterium]